MAPQIGPNEAPIIVNRPIRFAAAPVIASTAATIAPAIVDVIRGTPGIIVARLLPAMKDEKHIGATEATANRKKGRRYADRRANGLKEDAKGRADFAIIREGVERSAPTLIELVS